jgi:hypothetical protein
MFAIIKSTSSTEGELVDFIIVYISSLERNIIVSLFVQNL